MIADPEGKLRQIFEAVDVNRDGSINKREMIKFCRSSPDLAALLGFPEGVRQEDGSRDILERRFQAIDRDDDREVTWEEFLDFFLAEMAAPPVASCAVASAACAACEVEPSEPEPERADYREERRLEGPAPASNCASGTLPRHPSGPSGSSGQRFARKFPRVPVDEAFERAFEQKHQEWLKQDEKMRLQEEETRQAGVRAVQRLLEELSDNPFELIPRASELSAETLAEHFATEDVAQTLRALHKESARNLERLKFHVRMSSEEHSAAFPMAAEADATSNVCASAACEVVVNPPSWSGDLEQIADGSVQEPPAWAAGLVPMVPSCPAVSTPDLHKDGLEAPWAYPKPLDAALAAQAPQEREASAPLDEGQGSSASGTGQEMRNYQVGSDSLPGKKRCMDDWKNQDSSVIYPLGPTKVLVGVFDGHGEQGREVSSSVAKLFAHFAEDLAKLTEAAPMDQVLPRQFANLFSLAQDGLRRGGLAEWSGTTGTLAMIDTEAGCVVCAYVGDSRMIICHNQRVLFATSDHDVDDEAERRVTAAGGEVRRMWVSGIDARRVFLRGSDIPGLSMSRALGDLQASAVGVLNEPSIHTCVQIPGGSAVILASDGLWEKVTTQEVAAITTAALKLKGDDQGAAVAAKALVSEARSRWIQEGGDVDDITAVVVHLSQETMPELASGA